MSYQHQLKGYSKLKKINQKGHSHETRRKKSRMVILGSKSLLKETESKLKLISEASDEYSSLVNDAMLVETMI